MSFAVFKQAWEQKRFSAIHQPGASSAQLAPEEFTRGLYSVALGTRRRVIVAAMM